MKNPLPTSIAITPIAITLALLGLAACQPAEPPGPLQRAGAGIDRTMSKVQTGVGEFGKKVGEKVDETGRAVGSGANRVGQNVHDRLVPGSAAPEAVPAPEDTPLHGTPPDAP